MKMPGILILLMCAGVLTSACAVVPPEVPELSAALGQRLDALETAHRDLLGQFFHLKRQAVSDFIDREWVPVFASEAFSDPKMAGLWNTVVTENDPEQNIQFLIRAGARMQQRISRKRAEMMTPLEELEKDLEMRLRNEYEQARRLNGAIAAFLTGATGAQAAASRFQGGPEMAGSPLIRALKGVQSAVDALEGSPAGGGRRDHMEATRAFLEGLERIGGIFQ